MEKLKALLLGFVFVLSTSLCYAETGMRFSYFSAAAYKTDGKWEAYMLTNVVDEYEKPVEGVSIIAEWDNDDIEICHTNKRGRCKFHKERLGEDYTIFVVKSVEKKGYIFSDPKNMSMMIMRP